MRAARSAVALACHVGSSVPAGSAAVNVLAVFDREVFQIAQPSVDAAERIVGLEGACDAGLAGETRALRGFNNEARQAFAAAAVEAGGLGVFVDQAFEIAGLAGKAGVDERRRQVANGHAGDAPFRLRRFARIADDEGIDHRQRASDDLRKAFRAQRHGFSGQPFQRAVRAHVDERIGARDMAQPQAERDQRMAWRQHRIVIIGAAFLRAAAVGRQRDHDVAAGFDAKAEDAVAAIRIVCRLAPCRANPRGGCRRD